MEQEAARGRRGEYGEGSGVDHGGLVQADVRGGHAGDHDGDAERQVVDDPDGGDQAGALARAGQQGQDAVGAQEVPRPEARAGDRE